jgi:hypothetical protein
MLVTIGGCTQGYMQSSLVAFIIVYGMSELKGEDSRLYMIDIAHCVIQCLQRSVGVLFLCKVSDDGKVCTFML